MIIKRFIYILVASLIIYQGIFGFAAQSNGQAITTAGVVANYLLNKTTPSTVPAESCTTKLFWVGPEVPKLSLMCMAAWLANLSLSLASWVLWMAGLIFQVTLGYSLNMGEFLKSMPLIDIGWPIFRDLANICFIFILLYIAIITILQAGKADTKRLLVNVVLVALFLNFSLFFTRVIIDTSNILALTFYQKLTTDGKRPPSGGSNFVKDLIDQADGGLSAAMINGLGLKTVYKHPEGNDIYTVSNKTVTGEPTLMSIIYIGIGGSILIFVTAFVFLCATILFLIRTVILIFLMILSPVAFAALALPNTKQYFSKWWGSLIGQSFFAPIYMIMIWIVFAIVTKNGYKDVTGKDMNFAALLTGNPDSIGTAYTFFILIAFMLGSLVVSKQMGAYGGDFARKFGGKLSFGVAGYAGRQVVGRGAKALQESGMVKKFAAKGGFVGRGLERGLKGVSGSSFDIRNTGAGKAAGLGAGAGQGGYAKARDEKQKAFEDQKKRIGQRTPEEERKLVEAEEEKKHAQNLQAAKLLEERDAAEQDHRLVLDQKNRLEERKRASTAEIERIEAMRESLLDQATDPDRTPAEQEAARSQIEIDERTIKTEKRNIEAFKRDIDLTGTSATLSEKISGADKILKKIDDDYEVGGDAQTNHRVREQMVQKAQKSMAWANTHGIDYASASSDTLRRSAKSIQDNRIAPIYDATKARGSDYAKPGIISKGMAQIGFTTAEMAMVNKTREESRKSSDKKLLDQFKKYYEEQGNAPAATPPPPTPPAGGPATP